MNDGDGNISPSRASDAADVPHLIGWVNASFWILAAFLGQGQELGASGAQLRATAHPPERLSFVYLFPDYIFGVAKIQRAPIRLEGWLSRLL
jgi:hypothetical protein